MEGKRKRNEERIDEQNQIGTAPIIVDEFIHCCELLACPAYQEL